MARLSRFQWWTAFAIAAILAAGGTVAAIQWRPFWIAYHLRALKEVSKDVKTEGGFRYVDGDAIQTQIDALTRLGYYEYAEISLTNVPVSRHREIFKELASSVVRQR